MTNFEANLSATVDQKTDVELLIVPGLFTYLEVWILDKMTINLANSLIKLVPVCILSIADHTFLRLILNAVV